MSGITLVGKAKAKKDSLYLPELTYSIRNNCQIGMWMQSDGETPITNELNFCIVHLEGFYGDLGKTKGAHWLQLWGISDQVLNGKVIFCTYIKGRSLNLLGNKVLEATINEQSASDLLFKSKFLRQQNDYGTHYIIQFEMEQLPEKDSKRKLISDFLATNPVFTDNNIPSTLFPTLGRSTEECNKLLSGIRQEIKALKQG